MDVNQDELQLKKLLVDLEDEHNHLQASVRHLKNEVEKRELEVRSLLSQRELDIAKGRQHQQKQPEKPTQILENVEYDLIQSPHKVRFGVIVDCGSSGTRAHIFKWNIQHNSRINHIDIVKDGSGKPLTEHITPGLSSLRDRPDQASEYMEPIMRFISRSIPAEYHLDTPIFFLATAGLRLLERSVQRELLTDLTRDIRAKFDFPKIKSQVITGEYEGIYSWLSLNRRLVYDSSHKSTSLGMIEMGGASTQVAFELSPTIENEIFKRLTDSGALETFKKEQVTLKMHPNKTVKLFTTTFLGLGVNSARELAIDVLVRDYLNGTGDLGSEKSVSDTSEIRLKDPCLVEGSSELVLKPISLRSSMKSSLGYVVRQDDKTFRVALEGAGNFLNCKKLFERVLQLVKTDRPNCPLDQKQCSLSLLGTEFIPFEHISFIGLSEMFFTTNQMMKLDGIFDRSKILQETNRICSSNYNKLRELYINGDVIYKDRVLYECSKATWMLTILHNYGFRMPTDYDRFRTLEVMDGEETDWTMGAILSEVVLNK